MVAQGDQPLPQPPRKSISPTATFSFRTGRRPARLTQYCKKLAKHSPAYSLLPVGFRLAHRFSTPFVHRCDASPALRHPIAALAGVRLGNAAHAAHSITQQ
jgi:hypothetical protein